MLGCCRVVVAQWSEHRQLRSEALGSIPSGYPCIFSSVCFYRDLPPVAYHQFLPPVVVYQYSYKNNHVFTNVGYLASWWFSYPGLPLHHWLVLQAQILREGAGLLQGSRSSVVRASTAKVGGLGFDSQWLPMHFFFGMFLS